MFYSNTLKGIIHCEPGYSQ